MAGPASAQPSIGAAPAAARTYDGRSGSLDVEPPRLDASIEVDGNLNEAVWSQAAVLAGFSRYAPVDGAPADHATEVLVWYSPTAIHFGIRASAPAGTVRATLADRDRIQSDDHVIIFLSTYNDSRQALVFGVNPLGIQLDGAFAEGSRGTAATSGREAPDYSQDFVFQSKGRVTDGGYDVEMRIPFKSLRYQSQAQQDWGIHVTRAAPQQGIEDSWAPAKRDAASFLAQSGRLKSLTDLRRGLVLDLNPIATAKLDGHSDAVGWGYDASRPELGMNLRWGITPNLTMNGTVNPDFSQVESDAGQFSFDPRQALFFPEKRPFFLDGIEQFATPNNLIYTRRVAAPIAAAKITGKVTSRTNLAFLSAVDDASLSASGSDHPVFNILRVQQDVGAKSRAALVYTDRIDGNRSNRVIASDARLVWKDIYTLTRARRAEPNRRREPGRVRAAVAGRVRARRPALRGPLHGARRRSGLPRRRRLHLAHRRGVGQFQSPGDHLRQTRRRARALGQRRGARRHVAVRRADGGPLVAGSQAALQQQLHVPRRMARRRLGADRNVRLRPSRCTPTISSGGRARTGSSSRRIPTVRACRISITSCRR